MKKLKVLPTMKGASCFILSWIVLFMSACTKQTDSLPVPDTSVFGYEGETAIIFRNACSYYNKNKEQNQVFLPIVQVLGSYEEDGITKIVSCVSVTEMVLDGKNLVVNGANIFPLVTEIKYNDGGYDLVEFNSAADIIEEASASFPDIFLLVCGPIEQIKNDIEMGVFALPEIDKREIREKEYIEWVDIDISTINGEFDVEEYYEGVN